MSKELLLLLKVRFISQLRLNTFKLEKDKKKKNNRIMITVAVGLVIIAGAFYCGSMAYGLQLLGLGHMIPVYGFVLCTVMSFIFTIFKANGELFAYRDYEMLMSLPIKTSTVIASRFIYLYIWNTFLSAIILLAMGGVYVVYEKPGVLFYLLWIIDIFLVSLIPTTIATIIGVLIMAIASKSRHSGVIASLLTILLIIVILLISLFAGGIQGNPDVSQIEKICSSALNELYGIYPIAKIYNDAMVGEDVVKFLLFALISIGCYLLFIALLSFNYKKINTGLTTFKGQNNYKVQSLKKSNVLNALYSKEIKRFFSSSIYISNIGMGVIMALILSSALAVIGVDRLVELTGVEQIGSILPRGGAFAIAALVSMSCTTCVSLSLEGKNLWIIKTLPLTQEEIYKSKIMVNLTFTIPVSVICGILVAIGSKANTIEALLMILVPLAYSVFSAVWGIFINYKFVNYDWESETQVIKQSISAIIGMLGGLVMAIIPGVPTIFLSGLYYMIYGFTVVVVLLVVSGLIYKRQVKRVI